ncbi:helix-turn-helix transcriptional regulator [Burkholderia cepacia]|uniref:helix-turn-helix domain-containing protein n=1 Tax=Burkholderia cepacia TaxID=292 RepID=UPI002651FC9C|nr:helix-turn-helix transcriptional regulator [Burkholderia cepacia]MDN7894504.1 helix-turn-helix transcriptional regulator [Burkholderia cepacia]
MDAKEIIGLLRSRGLSQKQIAEKCGLSQGAISHIETGRRKNVLLTTHQQLQRLCDETATSDAQSAQVPA